MQLFLRALALSLLLASAALAQNAALMPIPRIQLFDANGYPLAGGLVFTCASGSSCPGTPLASYTDSTAAVPNPNPVVLDAGGFGAIWLGNGAYKIVVQNSLGVAISTTDNIPGNNAVRSSVLAALAAPGGSALVGTIGTGTGAVARPQAAVNADSVNVRTYGATCNGSGTGDQAGFAAAIAYMASTGAGGGGTLNIPAGLCVMTSTITLNAPIRIAGSGMAGTTVKFPAATSGFVFGPGAVYSELSQLTVAGQSSVLGADDGVNVEAGYFDLHDAIIFGFGRYGLYSNSSVYSTYNADHLKMQHVYILQNKSDGFHADGVDTNVQILSNVTSSLNGGYGFNYTGGNTNVLEALDATFNTAGDYVIAGSSNRLINPYCEASGSLTLGGNHQYLWVPLFGACTVVNTGGPSNQIITGTGQTIMALNPFPGGETTDAYALQIGGPNTGTELDLIDTITGVRVFQYRPDLLQMSFGVNAVVVTSLASAGAVSGTTVSSSGTITGSGLITGSGFKAGASTGATTTLACTAGQHISGLTVVGGIVVAVGACN